MKSLNLGILAHVDAGKTSLTEQILYNVGVIKKIGSVDNGDTTTDTMELEQQRGITIRSAVASFTLDDARINLVDTPGHPDFIAEVERTVSVLDGVILVISAVEGVQPQTRILMRTLQKLEIPTVIFINKIDRRGARYDSLLSDINQKLHVETVKMTDVQNVGTSHASAHPVKEDSADTQSLAAVPVFSGSAMTGAGIQQLINKLLLFLPPTDHPEDSPVSGSIFKIERNVAGEKITYLSLKSGKLHIREQLQIGDTRDKVTEILVYENGSLKKVDVLSAGEIGQLRGLVTAKIGDQIGIDNQNQSVHYFAPPTLETIIEPRSESDKGSLYVALEQLVEQDPLINMRREGDAIALSLFGEVQKEVIQDTLLRAYGLEVAFRETTTICVEKVVGKGSAVEFAPTSRVGEPELDKKVNQFLATVGLEVSPNDSSQKSTFTVATQAKGKMPLAFYTAVEETVLETLQQGLHGWQVTCCSVTLTHAGYWPRQSSSHGGFDKNISSTARDFRYLTPLVLIDALKAAGTQVCEPVENFTLHVPESVMGEVFPVLSKLRTVIQLTMPSVSGSVITGTIPAHAVAQLQTLLPDLTNGEGTLEHDFNCYQPITRKLQARTRSDNNPTNRREYLLNILNKK